MKGLFLKPSRGKLLSLAGIFCLGITVYFNSFHNSFQFDDLYSIINNPALSNILDLRAIWNFWPTRFITFLSFAFNYHFGRLDVFGYHLFNLAVHLVCAGLVFWISVLTFSTPEMAGGKISRSAGLIAFFAGLVFVAHPVQTQAVTYIFQRGASLAALFYLASLGFYVRSRLLQREGRPEASGCLYGLSLAAAIIAMFTKEISSTLPLTICLYEFSFFRARKYAEWKRSTPFLFTLLIIPLALLSRHSTSVPEMHAPLWPNWWICAWQYLLTQLRVIVTYIRLLFLPLNQNLDYDYPLMAGLFNFPVLASVLFLTGILIFALKLFRNYRLAAFGIFWFFLALLPESSIVPLKDVIFEHRLYLPMAGYSFFLVSGLFYLFEEKKVNFAVFILCLMVCFYAVLTYQRNKVWKDPLTLWSDVVRKSPKKARAYHNRGRAYYAQGNRKQAYSDFNTAEELTPKFTGVVFNRAITRYLGEEEAKTYYDRANSYSAQGFLEEAVRGYNRAIELNPDYAQAYNNRAIVYYFQKEYALAWQDVHRAEALGFIPNADFMKQLKKASEREK